MGIRVLNVSNISPAATKEQILTLFAYIGRIDDFKVFFNLKIFLILLSFILLIFHSPKPVNNQNVLLLSLRIREVLRLDNTLQIQFFLTEH